MSEEHCEVKRCRAAPVVRYMGHWVCQAHFDLHCDMRMNLKEELK